MCLQFVQPSSRPPGLKQFLYIRVVQVEDIVAHEGTLMINSEEDQSRTETEEHQHITYC
jgi:hypothetical protein